MRRVSLIVSVLLSVLVALLPVASSSAAAPERPARPLTVLTYNIHHAQGADGALDLERIAQVLEDSGAQIIALQEVDKFFGDRSGNLDQAAWLGERLGMEATFGANLDLEPAAPGGPRRQYGTAILSAHPIIRVQNVLLPKFPAGEQRGLLDAVIAVNGTPVRIMSTHLQHNDAAERLAQVRAIRQHTAGCDQPTVLMGDMNARADTAEYRRLSRSFTDVWLRAGVGPEETFDSDDPQGRIDYVFTANGITARQATVLQTLASDHLPVRAELRVPWWPRGSC